MMALPQYAQPAVPILRPYGCALRRLVGLPKVAWGL